MKVRVRMGIMKYIFLYFLYNFSVKLIVKIYSYYKIIYIITRLGFDAFKRLEEF